jgi:hypothetical protein
MTTPANEQVRLIRFHQRLNLAQMTKLKAEDKIAYGIVVIGMICVGILSLFGLTAAFTGLLLILGSGWLACVVVILVAMFKNGKRGPGIANIVQRESHDQPPPISFLLHRESESLAVLRPPWQP